MICSVDNIRLLIDGCDISCDFFNNLCCNGMPYERYIDRLLGFLLRMKSILCESIHSGMCDVNTYRSCHISRDDVCTMRLIFEFVVRCNEFFDGVCMI